MQLNVTWKESELLIHFLKEYEKGKNIGEDFV